MAEILVLYFSRSGHTAAMARRIARGIEEVPGMQARLLRRRGAPRRGRLATCIRQPWGTQPGL